MSKNHMIFHEICLLKKKISKFECMLSSYESTPVQTNNGGLDVRPN